MSSFFFPFFMSEALCEKEYYGFMGSNKEISLEGIEHDSLMYRIQFQVFGI